MKKVSTAAAKQIRNYSQPKLTIGLDLGDRSSWYCLLDEVGEVLREQKLGTTPKAMKEAFGAMPRCRIALETGNAFAVFGFGIRFDGGECARSAIICPVFHFDFSRRTRASNRFVITRALP